MSCLYNNNEKLPSVRNDVNNAAMLSTSKRHWEETVDYNLTSAEVSPLVVKKKELYNTIDDTTTILPEQLQQPRLVLLLDLSVTLSLITISVSHYYYHPQ